MSLRTLAQILPRRLSVASFSTTSRILSEGKPSGQADNSFSRRERQEEERFVRQIESAKLEALRRSIAASKAHLEELEKQETELKQESEKSK